MDDTLPVAVEVCSTLPRMVVRHLEREAAKEAKIASEDCAPSAPPTASTRRPVPTPGFTRKKSSKENEKHNEDNSYRKTPSKEKRSPVKSAVGASLIAKYKQFDIEEPTHDEIDEEEQKMKQPEPILPKKPSKKPSNDTDLSVLQADSIGANVRILCHGRDLSRMHWAAIAVPWSGVKVFKEYAEKSNYDRNSLTPSPIDIGKLVSPKGLVLFQEDFEKVFGAIFKNCFVPVVHAKFNGQGEIPADMLPKSVDVAFKLLVIAERLSAAIENDLHKHLMMLIHETTADDLPLASVSYTLINTSLSFSRSPDKGTLQFNIIHEAIDTLVKLAPLSIPALEDLVQKCCINQRPDLAATLFQKTVLYSTCKTDEIVKKQEKLGSEFFIALEKTLNPSTRQTTQLDLFALHMGSLGSTTMVASLKQGIVVSSTSGERVMKITGDLLHISRLGKPTGTILNREQITGISSTTDALAFVISSVSGNTQYRTMARDIRDAMVSGLNTWWHPDNHDPPSITSPAVHQKRYSGGNTSNTLTHHSPSLSKEQPSSHLKPSRGISIVPPPGSLVPPPSSRLSGDTKNTSIFRKLAKSIKKKKVTEGAMESDTGFEKSVL